MMDKLLTKIKLIFIPFLLVAIGFIGLYSFLNWLLIIHAEAVTVKQEIVDLWLPMALPWIPIWIWLSPRIKLLRLKKPKNDNKYK